MTENGRVALVSGGNRGIGLEIVRQLAERGITTILGSRDEASGREAAEAISGEVIVRGLDVSDEMTVGRLASFVEEEFGRLDVLVNSICPGWVQTAMGGSSAPRPVESGAEGAVWAATLPNNGPTGGFFRDRRQIPW